MVMTIDGGGSSSPQLLTNWQLVQEWNQLKDRISSVWTNGEKWEAQTVAKKVAEAWCDEVDAFNKRINELDQRFTTVVPQVDAMLKGVYDQHDGVATKLLDHQKKWNDVWSKVNQVHAAVDKHLQLDDWTGKGGEEYKAVLPTQMKALEELRGLASSQGQSCDQAGLMNAYLYQSTRDSIRSVKNTLPTGYQPRSITGSGDSTMVGGQCFCHARYAVHSYTLASNLEALLAWMQKQTNAYDADWAGAAQGLKNDLHAVMTAPLNLQPGGKWPGISMRVQAAAQSTGDLGYNSTYVGSNYANSHNGDGTSLGH